MRQECMIEMAQHLHMKHLDSFSFTSFSKNYNFIIPPTSNHYHRFDWLLNSSCQQELERFLRISSVLKLPPKSITIINFVVHSNPKGDWCAHINSLVITESLKKCFSTCSSHSIFLAGKSTCWPDNLVTTANRQIDMPYICLIPMLSDNYVQNTLKKNGLLGNYLSSVEESYFEVFLNSCKQKERDTHEHISIHLEIYIEYFQCGVYLLI